MYIDIYIYIYIQHAARYANYIDSNMLSSTITTIRPLGLLFLLPSPKPFRSIRRLRP